MGVFDLATQVPRSGLRRFSAPGAERDDRIIIHRLLPRGLSAEHNLRVNPERDIHSMKTVVDRTTLRAGVKRRLGSANEYQESNAGANRIR